MYGSMELWELLYGSMGEVLGAEQGCPPPGRRTGGGGIERPPLLQVDG
jgi:hypothetical protein